MNTSNTVELIGYYGSDIVHAQSAWTSTNREMSKDKFERVPLLLKTLAEEGHHTPFEKSSLHFLVTTDIATHIHLLKHRVGVSINGESARYKELREDKYYLPQDWWDKLDEDKTDTLNYYYDKLRDMSDTTNQLYHECLSDLAPILGRKRAKETARYFKMYNSQITSDIMLNWRSFVHFYRLRAAGDAQLEVRLVAEQMLSLIENIPERPFQHTIEAFDL